MITKQIIEEIVKRWNGKDTEGAKRLFFLNQARLPGETRAFFINKFKLRVNKVPELVKYACDVMGGRVFDENGKEIYENKNPQKGDTGKENPKPDIKVAYKKQLSMLEK